jgi:conjugative transfer pilus assembly protein TraH
MSRRPADCSAQTGKGALELARERMVSISGKIRTAPGSHRRKTVRRQCEDLAGLSPARMGRTAGVPDSVISDTDQLVALSLAYQMLNDLTRSIDFTLTNAERGATVAGAASSESSKICQTRILSKGIEQLRDLREDVLRQRAQMRQSYLAALSQANLSANYAGLLRQRGRDAREAAAPPLSQPLMERPLPMRLILSRLPSLAPPLLPDC